MGSYSDAYIQINRKHDYKYETWTNNKYTFTQLFLEGWPMVLFAFLGGSPCLPSSSSWTHTHPRTHIRLLDSNTHPQWTDTHIEPTCKCTHPRTHVRPTQSHSLKLTVVEMHLHCFGQLYKLLPWVMLLTRHMVNMELTRQYNLHTNTSWHTDKEHWRKFVSVRSYCGRYTMPNLCV